MASKARKSVQQWFYLLNEHRVKYPFGPIKEYRNEDGRLHREGGPASITPTQVIWYINGRKHGPFADVWGTELFYYENILVPKSWIDHPEKLTLEDVLSNANQELRYVGIRLYGYDRIIEDSRCKVVDEDTETERILFEVENVLPVPFRVVKVLNSTPEIDGTRKPYFLTVPATCKTCKEAVAWTFTMEEKEYHPLQET